MMNYKKYMKSCIFYFLCFCLLLSFHLANLSFNLLNSLSHNFSSSTRLNSAASSNILISISILCSSLNL
ncbi:MAG: hypothetical protein Q8S84_03680 [bacterium]|nr:hypothetical protein [bacterium]